MILPIDLQTFIKALDDYALAFTIAWYYTVEEYPHRNQLSTMPISEVLFDDNIPTRDMVCKLLSTPSTIPNLTINDIANIFTCSNNLRTKEWMLGYR